MLYLYMYVSYIVSIFYIYSYLSAILYLLAGLVHNPNICKDTNFYPKQYFYMDLLSYLLLSIIISQHVKSQRLLSYPCLVALIKHLAHLFNHFSLLCLG